MCREYGVRSSRKRKGKKAKDEDNGFGAWGGYMEAKKSKLLDQFRTSEIEKVSDIFQGVAIHVNGLTKPPAPELKNLMAAHGGLYHMYQASTTTHIIASNLPNVKVKQLGTVPIVKPTWITDSISFGKLLDYRRYLLYTNQSTTQPRIDFPVIEKPSVNDKNDISSEHPSRAPTKTASDPNFLEEFYNNSRLHLISTLGAEFKQLVVQMREKSEGKFLGKEKLLQTAKTKSFVIPHPVIMHIDMDCFFVSVGLRSHPELRGKPVAITHSRNGQTPFRPEQKANRELEFALYSKELPEGATSRIEHIDAQASMSEIASCSYEARKCGIKNGMFMGQAKKLCPELKTLPYDFEGYKEVSHVLYETVASYTLDIEAVSCDEMYVDVTNLLKETGLTVDEWATHIRKEIMTKTYCPCSTGFGSNRLQARLATRKAKPAGQYYLEVDDVEVYMAEIPLSDLPGVGRATLAKLRNLGLHTCGDVQVASLKVLQSEIGQKAGETLKEQSRGVDNKPLNFHHERKSVSAEINYGIRFKTLDECYNFLQSLSNEVYSRLNDVGMRARCLTLKLLVRASDAPIETAKFLGHGICDSLTKSTASSPVINNPQIIFAEAKALYEKLNPPFADLRGVGIQLTKLEKNTPTNNVLSNFLKQAPSRGDINKNSVDVNENSAQKSDGNGTVNGNSAQISVKSDGNGTVNENNAQISGKSDGNNTVGKNIAQKSDSKLKSLPVVVEKKVSPRLQSVGSTKSKRGRPGGGKNVRMGRTTGKSKPINQFFGTKKPVQQQKPLEMTPQVTENIDLDVLKELPEDIRNEIIKEYGLEDKMKSSTSSVTVNSSVCNQNVVEKASTALKSSICNQNIAESSGIVEEEKPAKKCPFSTLTWTQIKPILKKWIKSENEPSAVDVDMIACHFRQLAIDREIDVLKTIFNFLHRVFSDLGCSWHKAYYSMVNTMQEGMVARYGATLFVERQFECCCM